MELRAILLTFYIFFAMAGLASASEFDAPWRDANTTIILDPYHGNKLDFDELASDKKVVAIIHQATQGLVTDKKYDARRLEALKRHYFWGSYHLLTIDDVKSQISLYLKTVGQNADETHALDIECVVTGNSLNPDGRPQCEKKFSAVTVEQALNAIDEYHRQFLSYPLLYMNDDTSGKLKTALAGVPAYKNIQLWYARFKTDITGVFPIGTWKSYTLWQFSSQLTCMERPSPCTYRVPGTDYEMDVNIFNGDKQALRQRWPLDRVP